jgi:hypothetical protein
MYCPNCGATNSTEQNFCRSCGLRLEEITGALLVQVPSARSMQLVRRDERIKKIGRIAIIGLGSVSMVGVAALVYQVLMTMILSGTNIAGGIFILALMAFLIPTFAYMIYTISRRGRPQLQGSETPRLANSSTPATQLLTNFEEEMDRVEPPSVTEESTRHLE